jgi:exodeoxyribonuclease V alpha subunit
MTEIPVPKLPDYHPAWSITIHRSQGSEYSNVLVVVPQADSAMATRSLLYTAITRAKETVYVFGDLESVKTAIDTPANRTTLLEEAISRQSDE